MLYVKYALSREELKDLHYLICYLGKYCFKNTDKLSSVPELRKLGGLCFFFLKPVKKQIHRLSGFF